MELKRRHCALHPVLPAIERLEGRGYLSADLIPAFAGAVPGVLVTGQKTKDIIDISVTNSSASNFTGAGGGAKLTIYASLSPDVGAGEVALATVPVHALPAGASKDVKVPLKTIPAALPAGVYYLDARITQNAAPDADVFSSTQITVQTSFVDLTEEINGIVKRGITGRFIVPEVIVTNAGNIAAKGPLRVVVQFSFYSNGASPYLFRAINSAINLAPGATKAIKVPGNTPKSFPTFDYHMVVTINGNEKIAETNYSNDAEVTGGYFYLHQ